MHLAYVTLHVGAGTFQPVRVDNIAEHKMHSEIYEVPEATRALIAEAHVSGRKVLSVGTTSMRALESARAAANWRPAAAKPTSSSPRYRFRVVIAC